MIKVHKMPPVVQPAGAAIFEAFNFLSSLENVSGVESVSELLEAAGEALEACKKEAATVEPVEPVEVEETQAEAESPFASLGLSDDLIEKLTCEDKNGKVPAFESVEQLREWVDGGGDLVEKSGLGKASKTEILAALGGE